MVFNMFDGKCAYCGCDIAYEHFVVDHKVPYSISKDNSISNLYPSCSTCNGIKFNCDIEQFRSLLEEKVMKGTSGFILQNYYNFKPKKIVFYFEKLNKGGDNNG